MKNRIPLVVLGILVLVALMWRVGNPPAPSPPGPRGEFPGWESRNAVGEMAAHAVNPAGTAWAGVWNEETGDGTLRSAVWIIDFAGYKARMSKLKDGSYVPSLTWADDKTVRVLSVDSKIPHLVTDSQIIYIDAATAERDRSVPLKTDVSRILAWPPGSDKFLAELAEQENGITLAVLSESGEIVGKEVVPDLPKDAELYTDAALSARGNVFVFSVADKEAGGGRAYYTAETIRGTARPAFDLKDIPGRLEGMWVSPVAIAVAATASGPTIPESLSPLILMVCSERQKFRTAYYDRSVNKIETPKAHSKAMLKRRWPDAPDSMMFVTYNAGYSFDVATGKTKKLFDLSELTSRREEAWRQQIRDGRLYALKDGYISVSVSTGLVDIRQLDKKGVPVRDLLARQ